MTKKQLKVCSNSNCPEWNEKYIYPKEHLYCPYCGTKLYHVCKHKGCFEELIDPQASLCEKHMEEKENKKPTTNEIAKNTAAGATIVSSITGAAVVIRETIQKFKKS